LKSINDYKGYLIPLGLVGLATLGARTQNIYVLYGLILAICIVAALAVWEKIDERFYPAILFGIGLSLLYQTTLMSNGLVGTDIHIEYYFYQLAQKNGWDFALPCSYNACIGVVLIAPFLSNLFHVDGIWVFKAIYPLLFAFVSPLLYSIYKKQFGNKVAFLGVFFLIIVPTWSLELVGLPRQMLGEIMLVLIAWLVTVSIWRVWIKTVLIGVCAMLGILFHYVMGPIILIYLGISTVALLFFKARTFPVKWLMLVLVVITAAGIGWSGWVASGLPLSQYKVVAEVQLNTLMPREVMPPVPIPEVTPAPSTRDLPGFLSDLPPAWIESEKKNIFERQEPVIRTAFGLDFGGASLLGKIFRILQFATQLLLVAGCGILLVKRKKYSPEYLSWAFAAVTLAGACILIPRFANVINATRFYHLILLIAAPTLILGGQLIFRNLKILTVALLIPYFIFTSGVVFEISKTNDVATTNIPYSIVLSHERVSVAAVFTENDITVRDWAITSKIEPIFTDIDGMLLFSEYTQYGSWHFISEDYSLIADGCAYLPETAERLPAKGYIFLREWNTQHCLVTFKPDWFNWHDTTLGLRQSFPLSALGLGELLNKSKVVYRKGDAVVYEFTK